MVTVDGRTGSVYLGAVAVASEPVPQAAELLGWAHELGIAIGPPASAEASASATPAASEPATISADDCVQVLRIKGLVPAQGVADALVADPTAVQPALDRLVADGLSHKAIGARLLISEHTFDSHVRSILNKLGCVSRAQVAAWMASSNRLPSEAVNAG